MEHVFRFLVLWRLFTQFVGTVVSTFFINIYVFLPRKKLSEDLETLSPYLDYFFCTYCTMCCNLESIKKEIFRHQDILFLAYYRGVNLANKIKWISCCSIKHAANKST